MIAYCNIDDRRVRAQERTLLERRPGESRRPFLLRILAQYGTTPYRLRVVDDTGLLALAATAVLVAQLPDWTDLPRERIAMVFSSREGCRQTDLNFINSVATHPSARLFVQTLPNIAMGQVANYFAIRGENTWLMQAERDRQQLLEQVELLLTLTPAIYCLAGWVECNAQKLEAKLEWWSRAEWNGNHRTDLQQSLIIQNSSS
jgi:hypothetical protein